MSAPQPVMDMELSPKRETAIAERPESGVSMFERMARDPSVDVDKLDRLMQMHERAQARVAEELFNAAMSEAQAEMRPIAADSYNKQTASKFASYAALDRALRPIYTKHGFGLSFDTGEMAATDVVRVLCYVTHRAGHKRTYRVDMPADGKGAKGGDVMTRTHATGAGMQYGMRYLVKMIWNVAIGEADDDGNDASEPAPKHKPTLVEPKDFTKWFTEYQTIALDGIVELERAWKTARPDYRAYANAAHAGKLAELKDRAMKVRR